MQSDNKNNNKNNTNNNNKSYNNKNYNKKFSSNSNSNSNPNFKKQQQNKSSSYNFVEENLRLKFRNILSAFRENPDEDEYTFPSSLTNIERKYIHKLVNELGLVSKSSGVGENRSITVRKLTNAAAKKPSHLINPISINLSNTKSSFYYQKFLTNDYLTKIIKDINNKIKLNKEKELDRFNTILKNNQTNNSFYNVNNKNYLDYLESNYIKNVEKLKKNKNYQENIKIRNTLPAASYRETICNLINDNQIILISGETGCGKSTQVPQFILEDYNLGKHAKILMTQPRRLNVLGLSERIKFERNETDEQTIGYHIKLNKNYNRKTNKLLFVTTGILLNKFMFDKELNEYNIIIIDEAHEKDYYSEFLFILLRDLCNKRKNLKLILMSATFNTEKLRNYFNNIPHINIGCSIFPVSEYFLEDVLKFIQYENQLLENNNNKNNNKNDLEIVPEIYSCSICGQSNFLSPQELGIHSAFCFPTSNTNTNSSNNKSKNNYYEKKNNLSELEKQMNLLKLKISSEKNFNVVRSLMDDSSPNNLKKSSETNIIKQLASNNINDIENENENVEEDYNSEFSDDLSDEEIEKSLYCLPTELQEQEQEILSYNYDLDDPQSNLLLEKYQKEHTNEELVVDYDLIVSLLEYIFSSEFIKDHSATNSPSSVRSGGSILIFLPGWEDIICLQNQLLSHDLFNNKNINIFQLHSNIPKEEQELIFLPLKKDEIRIILSTNIAETSLTINNITIIINTCIVKEKFYDPYLKLNYLRTTYCSKSSVKQRKGRAGRLEPGVCFHLISHNCYKHLKEEQLSEILRIPLEEIILQVKALGVTDDEEDEDNSQTSSLINPNTKKTIKNFLLQAIDPPHELSISNGINLLMKLNFLTKKKKLTPLGESLCFFSLNPRFSKIFILASILGYYKEALYLITLLNSRSPFVLLNNKNPEEVRRFNDVKKKYSQNNNSDFIILINILKTYEEKFYNKKNYNANKRAQEREKLSFCQENFLSLTTMNFLIDTKRQYERQYEELFFYLKNSEIDTTEEDEEERKDIYDDKSNEINKNLALLLSQFSKRNLSNSFISNYFNESKDNKVLNKKVENLNENLILTIISSALYPNIALRYKKRVFLTEKNLKLNIHGSSINKRFNSKSLFIYNDENKNNDENKLELLSFHDLVGLNVQREGVSIDAAAYSMIGTSICPLISLLIFAGDVQVKEQNEEFVIISIDDWITLKLSLQDYEIIKNMRDFIESLLLLYVQKDINTLKKNEILQAIDCIIATFDYFSNNPL